MNPHCLLGAALLTAVLTFPISTPAAQPVPAPSLKQIAEGFVSPVAVGSLEDGSGSLLLMDQVGVIHLINKKGELSETPFLDLRDRLTKLNQGFDERGLVGLALHPRFKENGRFFVYYSAPRRKEAPEDWDHTTHVSEFKFSGGQADPASEKVVLAFDLPYFNHHGGALAFGPDGLLYISVGDGGGNGNDLGRGHAPQGNGQDTNTLLGKILRLDVDQAKPYAIPSDNPFARTGGRPEIFAYGLRNPWRMSFDRGGARELFVADVGQDLFEEVNIVVKGGNYGWNLREGFHCFDPKAPRKPPEQCAEKGADGRPLLDPILEYKNGRGFPKDPEAMGSSITGGYIYRGRALPQITGKYIFADWSRQWAKTDGILYAATRPAGGKKWSMEPLDLATHPQGAVRANVLALGEDADGELYVLTTGINGLTGKSGKVFKLVPQ